MLLDLWVCFQQQRNIGQRSKRHQRGFLTSRSTFHNDATLCLKCSFFKKTVRLNAVELVAPHARCTVDVACVHRLSEQRLGSAARNRHVLVPEFEQLKGIVGNVFDTNISADSSNKLDIQRLCGQGKTQGDGVVDARICVDDDARLS